LRCRISAIMISGTFIFKTLCRISKMLMHHPLLDDVVRNVMKVMQKHNLWEPTCENHPWKSTVQNSVRTTKTGTDGSHEKVRTAQHRFLQSCSQ
jgi:hypothetical protein